MLFCRPQPCQSLPFADTHTLVRSPPPLPPLSSSSLSPSAAPLPQLSLLPRVFVHTQRPSNKQAHFINPPPRVTPAPRMAPAVLHSQPACVLLSFCLYCFFMPSPGNTAVSNQSANDIYGMPSTRALLLKLRLMATPSRTFQPRDVNKSRLQKNKLSLTRVCACVPARVLACTRTSARLIKTRRLRTFTCARPA